MNHKKNLIVVTGAAGFIGSGVVSYLNEKGHEDHWEQDLCQETDPSSLTTGKSSAVSRKNFSTSDSSSESSDLE